MDTARRKLHYHLVDVFTTRVFGGNQLAVFTNGRGISGEMMQAMAKELNLSETTFVLPSQDSANDYRLRIFTPGTELQIAGHPTIGTAFVLNHQKMIDVSPEHDTIHFEEGIGVIPVSFTFNGGDVAQITMHQPLPQFGAIYEDHESIAEMLSINPDDIDRRYPIQAVSCGQYFLYVPLKNLDAIRRVQLRGDVWERLLKGKQGEKIFIFTQETEHPDSTVHSRMFAPSLGLREDPATGAASGPLGSYLVHYGIVSTAKAMSIISEQGFEMGRPSFIYIGIAQDDGSITGVYVGGQCVYIGEGFLEL